MPNIVLLLLLPRPGPAAGPAAPRYRDCSATELEEVLTESFADIHAPLRVVGFCLIVW